IFIILATLNSEISFISDIWTSPNNKAFVSATAHYIDENWAFKETIINFGLISRRHNENNIANRFFKVLKDYKITSK
ncbi:5528_t:CDS:1, partial [Dentiscutata heterogama]